VDIYIINLIVCNSCSYGCQFYSPCIAYTSTMGDAQILRNSDDIISTQGRITRSQTRPPPMTTPDTSVTQDSDQSDPNTQNKSRRTNTSQLSTRGLSRQSQITSPATEASTSNTEEPSRKCKCRLKPNLVTQRGTTNNTTPNVEPLGQTTSL